MGEVRREWRVGAMRVGKRRKHGETEGRGMERGYPKY